MEQNGGFCSFFDRQVLWHGGGGVGAGGGRLGARAFCLGDSEVAMAGGGGVGIMYNFYMHGNMSIN